ncbi:MAG: hypothetical protein J5J06_05615 [Phycisphaerae bacterium]|nr:hypothetical protein [Phycisphaerae bacterium]
MANKRVFHEVNGLVINGVTVAGATQISVTEDFVTNIDPEYTGGAGPSGRVHDACRTRTQVRTTDVVAAIAALIAAPTTGVWYGRESGATTSLKSTLKSPRAFALAIELAKAQLGAATLDFSSVFGAAETHADVLAVLAAQTNPNPQLPNRVLRIQSCVHGEDPNDLDILHVESLSLRVQAKGGSPLEDYGDDDTGISVVEIPEWDLPQVSLTIRDSKEVAAEGVDLSVKLLEHGQHDLIVTCQPVAVLASAVLTIRNVTFHSRQKTGGEGWTGHTLQGTAGWLDADGTTWRTIDNATPALRLVNWATS